MKTAWATSPLCEAEALPIRSRNLEPLGTGRRAFRALWPSGSFGAFRRIRRFVRYGNVPSHPGPYRLRPQPPSTGRHFQAFRIPSFLRFSALQPHHTSGLGSCQVSNEGFLLPAAGATACPAANARFLVVDATYVYWVNNVAPVRLWKVAK